MPQPLRRRARRLLAALALAALPPGAATAQEAPRFTVLHGQPDLGQVLARPALLPPARYRVLLVPGSGCHSLAPSADRLAAGLLHAEVLLLQKPHLLPAPGPGTAGSPCPEAFIRSDRLGAWLDRARQLAAQALQRQPAPLPLVLAGLSEGAELLPGLAAAFPEATLLVMAGHAGLDPAVAGRLQAERLDASAAWGALMAQAEASDPPDAVQHGRHLRYWRDLRHWRLRQPLLTDPRPLLHAWGGRDALMPPQAYAEFADAARHRAGGYCALAFPDADHELRASGRDHLQSVWAWLERLAREGGRWPGACFRP
ncbi:alpha/beta hydrolase [Azohydromonas caseinilytica]|uniref:Alpha/beta hydrolase n=1 Tax=Azohydromonas caseinilytica TaxID=2728836 RepID=A0A848F9X1_9BURK|nr:alpha/beta hydrolase [Azohydromonas caseinilytica]NML15020.1 alpha/beta hydrolase [Azohydromonas caseinilytica]